jgi:hypothetical protein
MLDRDPPGVYPKSTAERMAVITSVVATRCGTRSALQFDMTNDELLWCVCGSTPRVVRR